MTAPNNALRAARQSMRLSQDEFARALRVAGERTGQPNDANKRLVQRWESGAIATPRPLYARALEVVTGQPISTLGFTDAPYARLSSDARGGHDLDLSAAGIPAPTGAVGHGTPRSYTGVWLSRYEYYSSGREDVFLGQHYVVVLQHGDQLSVRSLPSSSGSQLTMDLSVDGNVVTGTWVEHTAPGGYYRGAVYRGALQLLAEPTGRRMAGKWVGFGKELEVNSGPWELVFQDGSTARSTLERYNQPPPDPREG